MISLVISICFFEGLQEFGRCELQTIFVCLPEGVLLALLVGDGDFAGRSSRRHSQGARCLLRSVEDRLRIFELVCSASSGEFA